MSRKRFYHTSDKEVCIAACEDYSPEKVDGAVKKCIDDLHALAWVTPGMKIGIKVNLVSGLDPSICATTHPQIVYALCKALLEKGADVVIGDSPGGLFHKSHVTAVYKASRMNLVEKAGGTLNMDFSVADAVFPEAVSIKTFSYTAWLDHVDAIINVSKLKTHAMMSMSCCVKNLFGCIPGVMKPEYHMRFPHMNGFANLMVDLNEYFTPVLQVVDAVDGMEGNGPTAGTKRHIGALIMGWSPYYTDTVCADIIGLSRKDVPTLEAAYERQLGPESINEVNVNGNIDDFRISDFKLATHGQSITFGDDHARGKLVSAVLKGVLTTRPQLNRKICIGCGKCGKICPAKAIEMVHGKPQIDRKKCIHCFCCQEFCPKGAMRVYHHPLGKIIRVIDVKRS